MFWKDLIATKAPTTLSCLLFCFGVHFPLLVAAEAGLSPDGAQEARACVLLSGL